MPLLTGRCLRCGGETTETLVDARMLYIDRLLRQLWYLPRVCPCLSHHSGGGGYGRAELYPLSDIDELVLSQVPLTPLSQQRISELLTLLWNLKLEVSHSVAVLPRAWRRAAPISPLRLTLLSHA